MDAKTCFRQWLDVVADLTLRPTGDLPRDELTAHLVETFQARVSWHWAGAEGSFGFQMRDPLPGWPTESDLEPWRHGIRLHPLVQWARQAGDVGVMTIGRVPRELAPAEGFAIVRDHLRPVGLDEQMAITYEFVDGITRTVVLSQTGEDFTDGELALARRIQPLLQLLARQCRILRSIQPAPEHDLTGRELSVLGLLTRGDTARAIGRRLGISPRTVEVHLMHIYRKLGVRDRLQAVLVAQEISLFTPDQAPGRRPTLLLRRGCNQLEVEWGGA